MFTLKAILMLLLLGGIAKGISTHLTGAKARLEFRDWSPKHQPAPDYSKYREA